MTAVFTLLLVYQTKHFLADYPLQSHPFFIGKFRKGWEFVVPLAVHCGIHGALTLAIALWWGAAVPLAAALAGADFSIHFGMDRLKAGERYMGRWKALSGKEYPTANRGQLRGNTLFWNALGLDQMVHHLTHYAIVYVLVTM